MTPEQESAAKADAERALNRRFYLPRLDPSAYQGTAVVHWSLPMERRATGWLDASFHASFRELMLHAAAREDLVCPVYCLMPDHLHLIWMGLGGHSDQRRGMAFLRTQLKQVLARVRFQHQAHDHVMRNDERTQDAFAKACRYVMENPVRAGLISEAGDWEFTGAVVPGYPTLHPLRQEHFWAVFWKVYWAKRSGFP